MVFRDERDALAARNSILERELEEAREALADKEEELERAKDPPPPEDEPAAKVERPEPASSPPSARHATGGDARALGARLAEDLMSDDEQVAAGGRRALKDAEPAVSDAVAKVLAKALRSGGPDADRACRAFKDYDAARFGGSAYSRIFKAFMKLTGGMSGARPKAEAAMAAFVKHGDDQSYLRKKEKAKANAPAGFPARVLSVFTRAWVIVVFGLPALFAVIMIVSEPTAIPVTVAGLAVLATFCITVDAYLRRCPKCRRRLAGKLLSIVGDNYGGHTRSWSCAFCKHRWKN